MSGDGWWCNGKEIAHAEEPDLIDIRVTKPVIRELREILRSDQRVIMRKSASDWIEVRYRGADDLSFVVDLVERAAAAYRAPPGQTPVRPPTGAALERRRRFH